MSTIDLTDTKDGMFTRFMPHTTEGEIAWNEIAKQTSGTGAVFTFHEAQTLKQLRAAGYTVRKAKKDTMTIDDILNELTA